MKLFEFFVEEAVILEGGNIFNDVAPFEHSSIPAIMKVINSTLEHVGARAYPIGSGATPTPGKISGDLDMIVDQDLLGRAWHIDDAKLIRKKLRAEFDAAGLQTGQSGVSVHVRVPAGGTAHQVDIMVVPKAENAARFHTHNIPAGSPYKGVNKQIAMALLAKERGFLWSPYQGLFRRDADGKKGALATDDLDEVATLLLGKGATGRDFGSVESILNALPPDVAAEFMAKLQADPAWPKLKESANMATDNSVNYLIKVSGPGKKKYFVMQYKPGLDGGNPLHLSRQIEAHPITQKLRAQGYDGPADSVVSWRGDLNAALSNAQDELNSGRDLISSRRAELERQVKYLSGAAAMMGSDQLAEWGSPAPGKIVISRDGRPLPLDLETIPGDGGQHHIDRALRGAQARLGFSDAQRLAISRELAAGREFTVGGFTFGIMRRKPREMS